MLEEAVTARLLPSLRAGLETKLRAASRTAVIAGAARNFRRKCVGHTLSRSFAHNQKHAWKREKKTRERTRDKQEICFNHVHGWGNRERAGLRAHLCACAFALCVWLSPLLHYLEISCDLIRYLEVGPWQPTKRDTVDRLTRSGGGVKVVAVCVSDDNRSGDCLVALTEFGAVRDHLSLPAGVRREVSL